MILANKKHKNGNNGTIKKIAVLFLLLLGAFFYAVDANAAAPGTNIEVCVQPPDPILTDPNSPVLQYLTKYHPFYYYQIQISKDPSFSPILYDTEIKAYQGTFSYNVAGTTSCTIFGCTFKPTVISGYPTPRCGCDTNSDNVNCPDTFGASASDPGTCYDWWTSPSSYSCSYGDLGAFYCSCPAGGICANIYCTPDPSTTGFSCSCSEGTCPSGIILNVDSMYGYASASCPDNPCSYSYSGQFNKIENPTAMPVGTYSYTVPPGTLPIDGSTYYYRVRVKDAYDWSPYAQGNFFLGSTDGVCGTSLSFCDGTTINPSTPGLCSSGIPSITSSTNPWIWICQGLYGGADSSQCSASAMSAPGCGTRTACSGDVLSCQPGMCTGGGTCVMTGDTTWTCTNSCGTAASCSATIQLSLTGECGSLDGGNFCRSGAPPSSDLCSPANSYNGDLANHYTEWTWSCGSSACGGSVVNCQAGNARACGWIETNP